MAVDGFVPSTRHADQSETSRESSEGTTWIGWVLEGERGELDEVIGTSRADIGVGVESDGAILADIYTRSGNDVLQAGLLELTTSAEVNSGGTDLSEKRCNAVVSPVDSAFKGGRALVGCNGLCDIDGCEDLGDDRRGGEESSKKTHFLKVL